MRKKVLYKDHHDNFSHVGDTKFEESGSKVKKQSGMTEKFLILP